MSLSHYAEARQLGQKEYRARIARGEYPYLQVLDEVLRFAETQGEESLGLIDIPAGHIVGTRTEGRRNAFAANFMPLLEESSEFAAKWSILSEAHIEEGIRDPIVAYEYMNRFYVQEGNKRVSVLKFFGAAGIPGTVRRILPKRQDTDESRIYFDFLDFYRLTKINYLWFSQPGRFKSLLAAVKGENAPWTDADRAMFYSAYARFRRVFKAMGGDRLPGTTGDAFLAYVKLHDLGDLRRETDAQLKAGVAKSWKELVAFSLRQPVELELAPPERQKSLLDKLIPSKPETLRALFLYEKSPETSAWTHAHDQGRRWAQEALEGRVETAYLAEVAPEKCAQAILDGWQRGADVIFTTSPKLLPACLKAAAEEPKLRVLNCSVYTPHPSIRTYYGRMYESKFLSGVIAGAMTHTHKVGYIVDYPLYGVLSAVNAFALGVRMTDPWAKVCLAWRCRGDGGLWESLVAQGVDMISGQDVRSPVDPWRAFGLYRVSDGVGTQIATAQWNWGRFYQRILQGILEGGWRTSADRERAKAINYWWGLSAGVVDLECSQEVPASTIRLTRLLKEDVVAGRLHPFEGRLVAQDGRVIQEEGVMAPEEIVRMDWLAENVEGDIPAMEEMTEEAQALCAVQGIWREETL